MLELTGGKHVALKDELLVIVRRLIKGFPNRTQLLPILSGQPSHHH